MGPRAPAGAGRRTRGLLRLGALSVVAVVGVAALDVLFPLPESVRASTTARATTVVVAADGTLLRAWPGADGAMRHPSSVDTVSPLYLEALLAYEDRRFARHPGVDPLALLRAGLQWLRAGRVVSGGSTLTMQVARLVDPPADGRRSIATKLRQIARALQLEAHLDKREILELYLDHAPMGGRIAGVEMGARAYLGKPARELSHAEAALLVALPQRPSALRPDRAVSCFLYGDAS